MGKEIERKFLLKNDTWKQQDLKGNIIKQGYLNSHVERTVRVRVFNNTGFLTIKGRNNNITREEFEYTIPLEDAKRLLDLCEKPLIEKTRYLVEENEKTWEVDVFEGDNKGLIVAEIELSNEDEELNLPDWIGEEISNDIKYYNSSLLTKPFINW